EGDRDLLAAEGPRLRVVTVGGAPAVELQPVAVVDDQVVVIAFADAPLHRAAGALVAARPLAPVPRLPTDEQLLEYGGRGEGEEHGERARDQAADGQQQAARAVSHRAGPPVPRLPGRTGSGGTRR